MLLIIISEGLVRHLVILSLGVVRLDKNGVNQRSGQMNSVRTNNGLCIRRGPGSCATFSCVTFLGKRTQKKMQYIIRYGNYYNHKIGVLSFILYVPLMLEGT